MENADVLAIQTRIEAVLPTLNEYQRRRFCVIDESDYVIGIKVSDEEPERLNIVNADFHGEWNYSLLAYS
jgi:hypothetical protein